MFQMSLVTLQFFQLPAHLEKALLCIQGRIIYCPDLFTGQLINLIVDLLQVCIHGRVALGQFTKFHTALFQH